jgi:hypothetical protein
MDQDFGQRVRFPQPAEQNKEAYAWNQITIAASFFTTGTSHRDLSLRKRHEHLRPPFQERFLPALNIFLGTLCQKRTAMIFANKIAVAVAIPGVGTGAIHFQQ